MSAQPMVQELETLVDQAVRVANRRRARLAAISLAGGWRGEIVLTTALRILRERQIREVAVDFQDLGGPLRLVALEIEKGD